MRAFKVVLLIASCVLLQNCSEEDFTLEQEQQMLADKLSEIEQMADNANCDGKTFEITAFGSKACGGPSHFIAYSNSIDMVKFIRLLGEYTAAEKAYNNRWGVFSDCSLLQVPKEAVCNEGELSYTF